MGILVLEREVVNKKRRRRPRWKVLFHICGRPIRNAKLMSC
jgi:hypothetical protein